MAKTTYTPCSGRHCARVYGHLMDRQGLPTDGTLLVEEVAG